VRADAPKPDADKGRPFAIGKLDSSVAQSQRPSLFASQREIATAIRRLHEDSAHGRVYGRLLKRADQHLGIEIKPLDDGWWDAIRDKPWEQTYPEIYENTLLKPNAYARPAADLALAWLLTKKDSYADKAIALVMNLANYSFRAEHFDVGMNYTIWAVNVLKAYDALLPRMQEEQRRSVDAFMTRLAAAVAKNDAYWIANDIGGGVNNHLAWHKLAFGLLGMFYDRPDMVEHCLHGPRGMVPLLDEGLLDDGLWRESSLVYQFAAIAPMLLLADCQRRAEVSPALHEVVTAKGRKLKQACDAMFGVLAPDGTIPPIGDAYGQRAKLSANPVYEYAYRLWGDDAYAWLVRINPEPSDYFLFVTYVRKRALGPPIRSRLYPEHGYAFLRSHSDEDYWDGGRARCAFLTYDRSHVHAHADKLSLMLFGPDRMYLSDVEGKATVPHAFSSRIQGELNRGGLSHNTVMIDGRDQTCGPRMLKLVEYDDQREEKRVIAADEEELLYKGVRQMRTVVMTSDYVLDVFQVRCKEERQIDWIAHAFSEKAIMPEAANPVLARCRPFTLPTEGAWRWLRDGRSFTPADTIRLEWMEDAATLRLCMLPDSVERVIFCGYPATDEPTSGSIPMTIVRQRGRQAIFAAVWLMGERVRQVEFSRLADRDGKMVFQVTADDRQCEHPVPILDAPK